MGRSKPNKAIEAMERRKTMLHAMKTTGASMTERALRHYAGGKRDQVRADLKVLAKEGKIEMATVNDWNPNTEAIQIVYIATYLA